MSTPFPRLLPALTLASALLGAWPGAARADDPPGGFPPAAPADAPPPQPPAPAPLTAAPVPANLPKPVSRRIQGNAPAGAWTAPMSPAVPTVSVQRQVQGTGILEIQTTESVPLAGGGDAVQFTVRFQVAGDASRHFYLNAVFFDQATGQAVRAQRPAFADASTGALYVISKPVIHEGGTARYEATLQVPHDAVPTPAQGAATAVEARISLFRRALGSGMDESMDWSSATFRVRGPAPLAITPAAPVAPAAIPVAPAAMPVDPGYPQATPSVAEAPIGGGRAAPVAPATSGTRILQIVKNHDQSYPDGRLGLRLDVRYTVSGDAGRAFYLHGLFFDQTTGKAVTSNRASFADRATGALYVITQPGAHPGGTNEYQTSLWVPYDAFPRPAPGTSTPIEARITLFRRDQGSGMDASMDVSSTTFKVHGE